MPPVARKFLQYEEGSAEEALQQAITERYGGNNEPFFALLAEDLKIRSDSVSGTFYKAMRRDGNLPAHHKAAYAKRLDISPRVLDEIGREAIVRAPSDPLAALEARVAQMEANQETGGSAVEQRLLDLETAVAAIAAGRRADPEAPPHSNEGHS